jgi:hypothetical protein
VSWSSDTQRRRPRLVIVVPLEGIANVRFDADSHDDELRLRSWLRAALGRREPFNRGLERLLDALDEGEAA